MLELCYVRIILIHIPANFLGFKGEPRDYDFKMPWKFFTLSKKIILEMGFNFQNFPSYGNFIMNFY